MAFTEIFDVASPADDDNLKDGDDAIRQMKRALDERLSNFLVGWPGTDPLKIKSTAFQDAIIGTVQLADASVTTVKIADSAVTRTKIPDDEIIASKLFSEIGRGAALNEDPSCKDLSAWINPNGATVADFGNSGSTGSLAIASVAGTTQLTGKHYIAFDPAKVYRLRAKIRRNAAADGIGYIGLEGYTGLKVAIAGPTGGNWYTNKSVPVADTWTELMGYIGPGQIGQIDSDVFSMDAAAAGVKWVRMYCLINYLGTAGNYYIQDFRLEEVTPTSLLLDKSVKTAKLDDLAVTTAKLANLNVTTGKLADGSVTNVKLENEAISTSKIAIGAVTTAQILDDSITQSKLVDGVVATAKIENLAVTTAKIADGAITKEKLWMPSVDSSVLEDNSVVTSKIANSQVTTAKIADAAVTTNKLQAAVITNDKISSGAVLNDHITSVAGSKITGTIGLSVIPFVPFEFVISYDVSITVPAGSTAANNVVSIGLGYGDYYLICTPLNNWPTSDAAPIAFAHYNEVAGGIVYGIRLNAVAPGGGLTFPFRIMMLAPLF